MPHGQLMRACVIVLIAAMILLTESKLPLASSQSMALQSPDGVAQADDVPPCAYDYSVPYHNTRTTCIEVIYDAITVPEAVPHLMGLALDDDGTLYFALTALGELWMMPDQDGDDFPDPPQRVADMLEMPTALTWHAGALYILTHTGVIRLDHPGTPNQSRVALIVGGDDWSASWPGSIGIGPDERLYISLSAACAYCSAADSARGVLLSYTLDGSDERVELSGLRQPLDFAWHPQTGQLWLSESAPLDLDNDADSAPSPSDWLLTTTPSRSFETPPTVVFSYQSTPAGLAFYPYAAFPFWQGDLLVVQRGSWNLPDPAGYALVAVDFDAQGQPTSSIDVIAPTADPDSAYAFYSISQHSLTNQGFFPQHPYDVVVDTRGWMYVSVEEGRILRIRPRPTVSTTP